jgi:enoyl-CoA hydratase
VTETDAVLVDVADGVATITLNRPEARNAINAALGLGLARAVGDCEARDDVAAMVLTGRDPAFCAGADLKELAAGGAAAAGHADDSASSGRPRERGLLRRRPSKPLDAGDPYRRDEFGQYPFRGPYPPRTKLLIGAVNGPAITGGFELALNCDFLVASDRARFADTHARVGVMPGWGLTVLLVETIGVRRARELSSTGNFIDAETALTWGLVNHVVPHEELVPFAQDLARAAAGNDQVGVRRMLATYDEIAATIYDAGWEVERRVNRAWLADGIDAEEVARRKDAIVERGRGQL